MVGVHAVPVVPPAVGAVAAVALPGDAAVSGSLVSHSLAQSVPAAVAAATPDPQCEVSALVEYPLAQETAIPRGLHALVTGAAHVAVLVASPPP